jgi:AAA+ superfamily predicted ATPase
VAYLFYAPIAYFIVGKTSTAECVAQLLGKPLFPITCGDLGTSAEQVESQLYEIFGKAEKWDCVLLLDEADVFLASRGKNDLKRNAVVSGELSNRLVTKAESSI